MKHIGLFEGIGGFSLAAKWMGWDTVAWCEKDNFCQKVLKYHFPNAVGHSDIKETDFKVYANQINILTGGFPCQPFSHAGNRKGTEDDRYLWHEMLRAIREIKPKWVVGENVPGILSWDGGVVFEQVCIDLENEGYKILPFEIPACSQNAPHIRQRIWFIAYSNSNKCNTRRKFSKQQRETSFTKYCAENFTNSDSKRCEQLNIPRKPNQQRFNCVGYNERFASNTDSSRWIQNNKSEQSRIIAQEIPNWERFPTESPICRRDDGISERLDGITFSRLRRESIKAYGNAIVPQVALAIFKAINHIELNYKI